LDPKKTHGKMKVENWNSKAPPFFWKWIRKVSSNQPFPIKRFGIICPIESQAFIHGWPWVFSGIYGIYPA